MILYHTTNRENVESIRRDGLDPKRAKGKIVAVWLHTASKQQWARKHLAKAHHVPEASLQTMRVQVPRAWLIRRRRGIWTCDHLISPRRIKS